MTRADRGDGLERTPANETAAEHGAGAPAVLSRMPASALSREGDFPLPYAVFSVAVDEQAGRAVDSHCAYASEEYCRAISRDPKRILGVSHRELGESDEDEWLEQCYRVVAGGEVVRGFRYDALVRDWVSFSLSPSAEANCCVYAFIRLAVDDEQRRQLLTSTDTRTSYFISKMLSTLSAEQSFESAMNGMLEMMSSAIRSDRLCVFECGGAETKMTFELCAEGVEPQLGSVFGLSKEILAHWFKNVVKDRVVLVPNVSVIEAMSPSLYQWCVRSGVQSLLAAPFFNNGEIVGFLGAYNYQIAETIDLNRLFGAVSSFIAARIENRQLINSLSHASTHDALTNLLNRRGAEVALYELLEWEPGCGHVLAILDIDDFKRINDVYGHGAGDEALLAMARALNEAFPTDAIISRNGGDEFMVVLSGEMAKRASSLLACLTRRGVVFEHEGVSHQLTLSVGYARYPEQATTVHDLITKADVALYAVKLAGKAGFGKYTRDAETHIRPQLGFSPRDILDALPYALIVSSVDAQGTILYVSMKLARMLAFSGSHELLRQTGGMFSSIVHPVDRERVHDKIQRHDESGSRGPLSMAFRALTMEGATLEVSATCQFADIEESGRVLYTLVVPVDGA